MLLKVGCFFLAQKFVLSIIVCIFAAREPAKPAQPLPIGAFGMDIDVTKVTLLP